MKLFKFLKQKKYSLHLISASIINSLLLSTVLSCAVQDNKIKMVLQPTFPIGKIIDLDNKNIKIIATSDDYLVEYFKITTNKQRTKITVNQLINLKSGDNLEIIVKTKSGRRFELFSKNEQEQVTLTKDATTLKKTYIIDSKGHSLDDDVVPSVEPKLSKQFNFNLKNDDLRKNHAPFLPYELFFWGKNGKASILKQRWLYFLREISDGKIKTTKMFLEDTVPTSIENELKVEYYKKSSGDDRFTKIVSNNLQNLNLKNSDKLKIKITTLKEKVWKKYQNLPLKANAKFIGPINSLKSILESKEYLVSGLLETSNVVIPPLFNLITTTGENNVAKLKPKFWSALGQTQQKHLSVKDIEKIFEQNKIKQGSIINTVRGMNIIALHKIPETNSDWVVEWQKLSGKDYQKIGDGSTKAVINLKNDDQIKLKITIIGDRVFETDVPKKYQRITMNSMLLGWKMSEDKKTITSMVWKIKGLEN